MNRFFILLAALYFGAVADSHAQTGKQPADKQGTIQSPQTLDQQAKTPVDPEALPASIKKAANTGEDYAGWKIDSAFLVKGVTRYYEVVFKKDKEKKTVKFSEDGNPII